VQCGERREAERLLAACWRGFIEVSMVVKKASSRQPRSRAQNARRWDRAPNAIQPSFAQTKSMVMMLIRPLVRTESPRQRLGRQ
jgi:hypothetical protein